MEILTINIAAGETKPYAIGGNYFEIVDAAGAVDVVLTALETQQEDSMRGALAGSFAKTQYSNFSIYSATAQTLRVLVSSREGGTRRLSGSVTITNVNGPFVQTNPAIGLGWGQVLAANTNRRFLEVVNTSAVADMLLTVDGTTPATGGYPLAPGDSWHSPAGFAPTGQINLKSSVAGEKAIVLEG